MKNDYSENDTLKNKSVFLKRVIAIVLVVLMATSGIATIASQTRSDKSLGTSDEPLDNDMGLDGLGLSGEDPDISLGLSGIKITADDLIVPIGKYETIEEINLLEGATAVAENGKDYTENLVVTTSEETLKTIDLNIPNTHEIGLAVKINDNTLATINRKLIISDGLILWSAPPLILNTKMLKGDEDFSEKLLFAMGAMGVDGNNYYDNIEVVDDGGGGNFTTLGTYIVKYSVKIEEEVVSSTSRPVYITNRDNFTPRTAFTAANANTRAGSNLPAELWSIFPDLPPANSLSTYPITIGGRTNNNNNITDNLKISFEDDGRTKIFKWLKQPRASYYGWVQQYFNKGNNSTIVRINNSVYSTTYDHNASNKWLDTYAIWSKQSPEFGQTEYLYRLLGNINDNIYVYETLALNAGDSYITKSWDVVTLGEVTNNTATLIYGGDTYFAGYDSGWSGFTRQAEGTVMTWRGSEHGVMSLQGLPGYRPSHWFAGTWAGRYADPESYGRVFAQQGQLNDYQPIGREWKMLDLSNDTHALYWESSNANYEWYSPYWFHDTAYYMQWDTADFETATPWRTEALENFADAGKIQLTPEGGKQAPPSTMVTHTFNVRNSAIVTSESFDVQFSAESEHGWSPLVVDPPTITALGPGLEQRVTVRIWVPETDNDGNPLPNAFTDKLTLKAKYKDRDDPQSPWREVVAESTTKTIINNEMPTITSVPIMYLDDNTLDAQVNYINVPESSQPVNFRLIVQTANYVDTPVQVVKTLMPGDVIRGIDISSLPGDAQNPVDYILFVEATDRNIIPYPHNSTRFTKGADKIIPPTTIKVDPDEITLNVGDIFQGSNFNITFTPTNVTNKHKKIIWESKNTNIATVNGTTGTVTAHAPGDAIIFARSEVNPDNVFCIIKVKVVEKVKSIKLSENDIVLKKGDSKDIVARVSPTNATNKTVNWESNSPATATVTPTVFGPSDTDQKASIKGINDGVTFITATSAQASEIKETARVTVDGTAPKFTRFDFEKTSNPWARTTLPTNKEIKVSIETEDPQINGASTGVDAIYYQVLTSSDPVPSFSLNDTTGWKKVSGNSASMTLNSQTVGSDNDYKVYAVTVDKVGNISAINDGNTEISVDTEKPVIKLIDGAAKDIHVLVDTHVDLMQDIVATDNGSDITSLLTVSPSSIDTSLTGKYNVKYSYTDDAGNSAALERTVYVHGKPSIISNDTININQDELYVTLIPADSRIALNTPAIKHYNIAGNELSTVPDLSVAGDKVAGNVLNVDSLANTQNPSETTVKYTASYNNNMLLPSSIKSQKDIVFKVYKNGTVPGGPDITVPPGVVIPPEGGGDPNTPDNPGTNPDVVDPFDPTGVYRIEYYQNNGGIDSSGNRYGKLKLDDIKKAVKANNSSQEIMINRGYGFTPLTEEVLQQSLDQVGQSVIRYKFTENSSGAVVFFTIYLRVNSDMAVEQINPIDARINRPVPSSDSDPVHITAFYKDYKSDTISLNVNAPDPSAFDTSSVRSFDVNYMAEYPFAMKDISRLLRVHGDIEYTVSEAHIRKGESIPVSDISGTIKLAPVTLGNVPVVKTVSNINLAGGLGDTSIINRFEQGYNGTYTLGSEYGSGSQFTISNNLKRFVSVHGNVELSGNDITVGLKYTKEMFGNPVDNMLLNIVANVQYQGTGQLENLKSEIKIDPADIANIKFGTPGVYTLPITVSDSNASSKPGALAPQSVSKTLKITVSQNGTGDSVIINGSKDINWLQDKNITVQNISGHVTASSAIQGNIPVTYTIKNSQGNIIDESKAVKNPGIYTITYTAIDSLGNYSSVESKLNVYGKIKLVGKKLEADYAVGSQTLDLQEQSATYIKPDGTTATITPASNPELFNFASNVDLNRIGRYETNLIATHPMFSENSDKKDADIRVHGIPTLSANSKITVNVQEQSIDLLNPSDTRLGINAPDFKIFKKLIGVSEATVSPELNVEGELVSNGKLNLSGITNLPYTTQVKFTASYNNAMLNPSLHKAEAIVTVVIEKNGGNPDGPDIEVPPGIVIPPEGGGNPSDPDDPGTNPGSVDPLNPTGVYRIEYFQNHGTLLSNGGRKSGRLSVQDITSAVKSAEADAVKITIEDGHLSGNMVALNDSSLNNALDSSAGQRKVVYEFKKYKDGSTTDFAITYFTVCLRVNSDMVETTATPVDTTMGSVVPQDQYTGSNNMVASYTNYATQNVSLKVVPPNTIGTGSIGSSNVSYIAEYPYIDMPMNRLVRVHGNIEFTFDDQYVRQTKPATLAGISAKVKVAPVNAGGSISEKNVTDISLLGSADTSSVGVAVQSYSANYKLDGAYKNPAFTITGQADRNIIVHGNPVISANNITVGLGYTKEMFGTIQNNPLIDLNASVKYYGQSEINLKDTVQIASNLNDVKFGKEGIYYIDLKVKDSGINGLPPETVTHRITVTVTDQIVGDAPYITGNQDRVWLQGNTIDARVIMGNVKAYKGSDTSSQLTVITSIKNNLTGSNVTQDDNGYTSMSSNPGSYTITYSTVDSLGNQASVTSQFDIYGKVKFTHSAKELNARVGIDFSSDELAKNLSAAYVDPNGNTITLTPQNDRQWFNYSLDSLKSIGIYDLKATVMHPKFPAQTDSSNNIKLFVHGEIEFSGIDELVSKRYLSSDTIDVMQGVSASYVSANKSSNGSNVIVNVPVTIDRNSSIIPPSSKASLERVTYFANDEFNPGHPETYSAAYLIDHGTAISITPTLRVQLRTQIPSIQRQIRVLGGITYSAETPQTPTIPLVSFDFTEISNAQKTNKKGTYKVYVYTTDKQGNKTQRGFCSVTLI